jgi:hypothetical protein
MQTLFWETICTRTTPPFHLHEIQGLCSRSRHHHLLHNLGLPIEQANMAKSMDLEQLPNSHHVEGDVASKSELQVNIPEARQSLIRKKVSPRMLEIERCTDDNPS